MTLTMAPTLLVVGCTSDQSQPLPTTTTELLASLAPASIKVEIIGKSGGTIRGNGTTFRIPPGAVVSPGDGKPVDGLVTVELRELLSPEAMMAAGRPTVTDSGELLESGGAFELAIRDGQRELAATTLLDLRITPEVRPSSGDGMELWVVSADGQSDWFRPQRESLRAQQDGDSFTMRALPAPKPPRPVPAQNIDKPAQRVISTATSGPVQVELAAEASSDAAVFFFPEGLFSVVRLDRDPASGRFTAPATAVNASSSGKLVVVSVAGGKLLFEQRQVSPGAPGQILLMHPSEVTGDELRARLRSM